MMKPEPTARKLIEHAIGAAARMFEKDGAIPMPLWHAVLPDGDHVVMPHPPVGDKDVAQEIVRRIFEEAGVVAYVVTMEAWLLVATPSEISQAEMRRAERRGLSKHPKRKEAVFYTAEDANGCVQAHQMIDRSGGKARLLPVEWPNLTQMSGRFSGMLPRGGKTSH
jgi:hypothetical protein